ncbi:unnamed protein product [Adineta ricciae]|nr:unnamed protein product [Adineta ricciae]
MTRTANYENLIWTSTVYTPLSSKSDQQRPITYHHSSSIKRSERLVLPKNHLIDNSFVSPSNMAHSSIDISRQINSSTKRYHSSFKTISYPFNNRQVQRTNSSNDKIVIFKLTNENAEESNDSGPHLSMKHSSLSMGTSSTITTRSSTPPPKQSSNPTSTWKSSPAYRTDGLKRRATRYDSPVTVPGHNNLSTSSNSISTMATSTSSHPTSNSSLFAYGSTITGGNTVRQRALAEPATNSLLITSERFKSHTPSTMRPARQSSTTTMPSAYMTSHQLQRNASQGMRSRNHQDKSTNSRDVFDYPDPFTNCPPELLSKLAQLTKLQMETVEWERKRRFTKKKSGANGTTQGKDSP